MGAKISDPVHVVNVDDELDIRAQIEDYFGQEAYRVTGAADGTEHHAIVEREEVDMIQFDLRLPR